MANDFVQQYRSVKQKHPGMVLLFLMGDNYEAFDEDAVLIAKTQGLVLTSRHDFKVAGFPRESLELYLRKLLHEGSRVAICEAVI